MRKKIIISVCLGACLSALTLYLAFRNVPFSDLVRYLAAIEPFYILPAVALALASFLLRTYRWRLILSSAHRIGFWRAYHPMMIGFMVNCILPARIGEVVRPLVLNRNDHVPVSTGLATVAIERVFDICLLLAIFAVVAVFIQIDPALDIRFGEHHLNQRTLETVFNGMTKVCLVLIGGMVLLGFERSRRVFTSTVSALPVLARPAGPRLRERIERRITRPLAAMIDNFARGLSLLRQPLQLCACVVQTLCIWGLLALSYWVLALGCPGIELTLLEMCAVMIIVCVFIALPSVPGFWGLWEAGGVFAMLLFGVGSTDAAGFNLLNHAVQMFPVIIAGLFSALVTGVNIWQVSMQVDKRTGTEKEIN